MEEALTHAVGRLLPRYSDPRRVALCWREAFCRRATSHHPLILCRMRLEVSLLRARVFDARSSAGAPPHTTRVGRGSLALYAMVQCVSKLIYARQYSRGVFQHVMRSPYDFWNLQRLVWILP